MKYAGNQTINTGDKVQLWKNKFGTVVCIIEDGEYSSSFPKKDWEFLENGFLIEMDDGELIHYPEVDEDLILVKPNPK